MAMAQVSQHQAEQSRFYGVKGWLLVFYILAVLSLLSALSSAFNQENAMVMGMDMGTWQTVSFVQIALALPFLILTPMKHRLMPMVSILCFWGSALLSAAIYFMNSGNIAANMQEMMRTLGGNAAMPPEFYETMAATMAGTMLAMMVVVPIVFSALFTWYLLASKRVNATFRHRLPESEARQTTFGSPAGDSAPGGNPTPTAGI